MILSRDKHPGGVSRPYSVKTLIHISVFSKVLSMWTKFPQQEPDRNFNAVQEVPECNEELQDKGKNRDWKEAENMAHHKAGENTAGSDRKKINISYKSRILINTY